jgi:hypothetical protein
LHPPEFGSFVAIVKRPETAGRWRPSSFFQLRLWPWHDNVINHKTAIFRQINKDKVATHHDALEFPNGQIVLLTSLNEDQQATVLQLPAEPKTAVEVEAQRRAAYVG